MTTGAERETAFDPSKPFQARVDDWLLACFGETIARDREERNHRFIEEALELVQANGCTASEAHQLVDYVYGRPLGELDQEVGGVMNTLAALCLASGVDLAAAAEKELARVWTKVEKIRAKQAAKPKHSPLPAAPVAQPGTEDAESDKAFIERIGREYDDMEGDPEPFEMRRLIALAAETTALRSAMSDAISLLQETTHGSPARSPGHNARVVLQAALAKRGLTGDRS